MGNLSFFDIARGMQVYNLHHFVETGTGLGESLLYACDLPFHSLWSCEIEPSVMERVMASFVDDRVTLFLGPSTAMLSNLWRIPQDERILFWLDAHFPGAHFGLRGYADEQNEAIRVPLKEELALIRQYRPSCQDVIVIDDARIWLDEPFERGHIHPGIAACRPAELGIGFIHGRFAETHRIDVLLNHEGYIILSPLWVSDDCALEFKA